MGSEREREIFPRASTSYKLRREILYSPLYLFFPSGLESIILKKKARTHKRDYSNYLRILKVQLHASSFLMIYYFKYNVNP